MTLIALLACQRELFVRNKQGILLVIYTILFTGYIFAGGLFFLFVEGPQVERQQKDILECRERILKKYANLPAEALDDFMNELKQAGVRDLPRDPKGPVRHWTLADAVFFVVTLLTTIGYGHVTPRSTLGKVLCLLYTAVGIPITLCVMASHVDRMMRAADRFKARLFDRLQKQLRPLFIRLIHILIILVIVFLLIFTIPASIFIQFEEGWTTFDGYYFCFISLTTVGLGDLVPALNPDLPYITFYKYAGAVYLMVGLVAMLFVMAMASDFQQNCTSAYHQELPFSNPEKRPINENSNSYGSLSSQEDLSFEKNMYLQIK